MSKCFQLDIVSAETEIYSGLASKLLVTGVMGELEILYGHAPLLTMIAPGPIWVHKESGEEEGLVVLGGMLEVQPNITTVLADAVMKEKDMNESAAREAKANAENMVSHPGKGFDYSKAHAEIAAASAQLRVLKRMKQLKKR